MNQTAHISLQILSISKSVETKSTEMRPNFLGAPRLVYLWCCSASRCRLCRSSPSGAPPCASAPPVRGYLRIGAETRKGFFSEWPLFLRISCFANVFSKLGKKISANHLGSCQKFRALTVVGLRFATKSGVFHRPIPKTHFLAPVNHVGNRRLGHNSVPIPWNRSSGHRGSG